MTYIPPIPKPSQVRRKREAIKVYPDGREVIDIDLIAGNAEYRRRTEEMAERQGHRCPLCNSIMSEPTFDHEHSRGGGRRDDRILVDGKWQNAAVCWICNGRKGSKHYTWEDGKYVPVLRLTQDSV